jgi:hypothetical protein
MGEVGTDVAIKHQDLVVVQHLQKQTTGFEAITSVEYRCQLRVDLIEGTELAIDLPKTVAA